jgi:hypothetical protein
MAQIKHLNVALPSALIGRLKAEAGRRGIKLYAALAEAINLWLRKEGVTHE